METKKELVRQDKQASNQSVVSDPNLNQQKQVPVFGPIFCPKRRDFQQENEKEAIRPGAALDLQVLLVPLWPHFSDRSQGLFAE